MNAIRYLEPYVPEQEIARILKHDLSKLYNVPINTNFISFLGFTVDQFAILFKLYKFKINNVDRDISENAIELQDLEDLYRFRLILSLPNLISYVHGELNQEISHIISDVTSNLNDQGEWEADEFGVPFREPSDIPPEYSRDPPPRYLSAPRRLY